MSNQPKIRTKVKLASAAFNVIGTDNTFVPWSPADVDKMESPDQDAFLDLVKQCRFFYRKDPIASTVINKLVEIGITDIVISKGKLSANEHRIFTAVKDELQEFAEACALEYLISGLVVPEIKYAPVQTSKVKELGIKKYSSIQLPVEMWMRDPATIIINTSMALNKPSYFVKIPEKLIWFITHEGKYQDGTEDPELYLELKTYYPEFVLQVLAGKRSILLENDLILRRKPLPDSPYPTPYMNSALEAMKHKRNLRKMDYSVASRVISAIQLIKMGDKDFPVTEDDNQNNDPFQALREQMAWRNSGGRDVERIFQLFANHTVSIEWVMPNVEVLLNERKYMEVNEDIFFSLGFPKILTTGESQRTGTSDPEFASLSPIETMKNVQKKILTIIKDIVKNISLKNNLAEVPTVRFKPVSLHSFLNFINGLKNLYDTGNLSRTSYDDAFGYDLEDELRTKADEQDLLKELKLGEFAPVPHSNQPGIPGQPGQPGNPPANPQPKPNQGNPGGG